MLSMQHRSLFRRGPICMFYLCCGNIICCDWCRILAGLCLVFSWPVQSCGIKQVL